MKSFISNMRSFPSTALVVAYSAMASLNVKLLLTGMPRVGSLLIEICGLQRRGEGGSNP
jgi:hypothetical protein